MTDPVHPWQTQVWARLCKARLDDRLPHALLVAGPGGTGERAFADTLGQALLCESDSGTAPCGQCAGCRQFRAGTHPDAVRVEPAEAGKAISVEAVRSLIERLALTGRGDRKVAIVDPAEAMTISAANSLLKTLEEPAGGSVLILVTRRSGRLPATIRSRCQRVTFGIPPRDVARAWLADRGVAQPEQALARAGGAPLQALEQAGADDAGGDVAGALLNVLEQGGVGPADVAACGRMSLAQIVPLLASAVEDVVRLAHNPAAADLRHPEQRERMARLARGLDVRSLFDYLDELYRSVPGASSSLRADLQFQGLLADAASVRGAGRARKGGS